MAHESFENEAVGAADQRRLRLDQGGPGGAARRRRRLHDRHPGDDRPGRLADDGLRHPGRHPVLLRHLLPAGQLRPAARSRSPPPGGTSGRPCCSRAPRWSRRSAAPRPSAARPPRSPPSCSTPPPTSSPGVRPDERRLRRRAEVPAAHEPALPAAPPPAHRLGAGPGDRPAHLRGDGPGRHLRPARRRLRPLLGRRALDRAALREDALRQRLLLRVYTQLWRLTGDPLARRVAPETAEFLVDDLPPRPAASPRRWTPTPRASRAPPTPGRRPSSSRCSATRTGPGRPTCSRSPGRAPSSTARACCGWRDVDDAGRAAAGPPATSGTGWRSAGSGSGPAARGPDARPQPARDDKVVAAWNGLAITALVEHAALTGDTASAAAAREAAEVLAGRHLVDGRLRRVSRDGVVGQPAGVLEDYGCVAEAFCALHQLTGEGRWLELAGTCSTPRWPGSPPAAAGSTTPPTTPSGWSPGRPTRPTTPPRPGCRRSSPRWSATRR